jgi:hypothetical protein
MAVLAVSWGCGDDSVDTPRTRVEVWQVQPTRLSGVTPAGDSLECELTNLVVEFVLYDNGRAAHGSHVRGGSMSCPGRYLPYDGVVEGQFGSGHNWLESDSLRFNVIGYHEGRLCAGWGVRRLDGNGRYLSVSSPFHGVLEGSAAAGVWTGTAEIWVMRTHNTMPCNIGHLSGYLPCPTFSKVNGMFTAGLR